MRCGFIDVPPSPPWRSRNRDNGACARSACFRTRHWPNGTQDSAFRWVRLLPSRGGRVVVGASAFHRGLVGGLVGQGHVPPRHERAGPVGLLAIGAGGEPHTLKRAGTPVREPG